MQCSYYFQILKMSLHKPLHPHLKWSSLDVSCKGMARCQQDWEKKRERNGAVAPTTVLVQIECEGISAVAHGGVGGCAGMMHGRGRGKQKDASGSKPLAIGKGTVLKYKEQLLHPCCLGMIGLYSLACHSFALYMGTWLELSCLTLFWLSEPSQPLQQNCMFLSFIASCGNFWFTWTVV